MKRNIEISFTASEIDLISEALTTVTGAPPPGTEKLLKRMQDITGEFNHDIIVSADELNDFEQSGKRTYKMRRHLNRKRYMAASGQVDDRAAQWAEMFKGVEPR